MGELVSLQEYRDKKKSEELDDLKKVVRAWANAMGEPEVAPYFLPLEEHLDTNTATSYTDREGGE